jgi:hypothetical protein
LWLRRLFNVLITTTMAALHYAAAKLIRAVVKSELLTTSLLLAFSS